MNTRPTLQTRRKAPSKSGFRILRAATRRNTRRKQRAATTATPEDMGEVPGVGISLALVVILLLHVAAIGGIYIHEKWNDSSDLKGAAAPAEQDKPAKPTIIAGGKTALVDTGDNYAKLAAKHNVSEDALRRINNNAQLTAGLKINIPPSRIESVTPSIAVTEELPDPIPPVERPLIQPNNEVTVPNSVPGELVETPSAEDTRTNEPILISPRVRQPEPAVSTRSTLSSSGTYTVKSGDTLWGISRKNGVSVKDLLTINSMKENAVLKIGTVLKIPAR